MINKKRFAKLRHRSKWTLSLSFFLLTTMAFADHPAAISPELPTAVVMAAGRIAFGQYKPPLLPFIGSSIDGGKTWEIRPITNLPRIGTSDLISSCTGTGNDAVCIASGFTGGPGIHDPLTPFVILSQDATKTWNFIDLRDQAKDETGVINGTASTGSGKTAIIVLTGEEDYNHHNPLLLVSTDGGTHWISKGYNLGIQTILGKVSCTGEGKTALCMSIDEDYPYQELHPLITSSTDGGNTWTLQSFSSSLSDIVDISCTGGNTCAALGFIGWTSVIKTTTDKGKNWKDSSITDGTVQSISCTGSGSSTFCAAVGAMNSPPYASFVTISTDNGATWISKPIKDNLPHSRLTNVSCTQTEGKPVCAAVGLEDKSYLSVTPMLVTSTDGGSTWQSIQNNPKWPSFQSVNCSPNGISAYCVAVTYYLNDAGPTLVVSSDLIHWKLLKSKDYTGPIPLPAWGQFDSAASTIPLTLPRKNDNFDRRL